MASILIIAADLNIESLLGELVAFAGHRPVYDVTLGAAGDSVRRTRPDVLLLDTALSASVVTACLDAASQVGAETIIISSTASPDELAHQAEAFGTFCFALPGGARPFQRVLSRALAARKVAPPVPPRAPGMDDTVNPSLRAALASMARAKALATRAAAHRSQSRELPKELRHSLDDMRRSRAALRAAVTDLALELKASRLPLERIVTTVVNTVADCATTVGAQSAVPTLLDDSAEWARSAYFAA